MNNMLKYGDPMTNRIGFIKDISNENSWKMREKVTFLRQSSIANISAPF